jgi:uncharacterized membrane protein
MTVAPPAATPSMAAVPDIGAAPFHAVLYPNRSLGSLGFYLLMGAIVLASAALGAGFALVGAWPVAGFLGLDVLLLYLAFRWNYRQGRRAELIRLDRQGLTVRRIEPSGRHREWRFEPYWVRVAMDDPPRPDSQLTVGSHGQRLVIGAFLSPEERLEVATALRAALRDQENAA